MSNALFSSEIEPADTQYLWRQELADLLDLATSALLGWGVLRALDVDRTPISLVFATVALWLLLSGVGGLSGWTFWRSVVGLRLVTDGVAPGFMRGLARALPALVDLPLAPILQRRSFDRLLRVHPEAVVHLSKSWRRSLGWSGLWVVLVLAAVWFMVMPTRREALAFLRKLDGWRCCHTTSPAAFPCSSSISRVVRAAEGGDVQSRALVADCPRAQAQH